MHEHYFGGVFGVLTEAKVVYSKESILSVGDWFRERWIMTSQLYFCDYERTACLFLLMGVRAI
jgi:hypothetical protein